jgi:multiple antibiotic resistance protein
MYLSLASNLEEPHRQGATRQAILTAFVVGVCFLFLGKLVFRALGITVADFQIAGGIILLAVAVQELVSSEVQTRVGSKDFGVVPLGMPLIAGPGMLTALLSVAESTGATITLGALLVNLAMVWLALRLAEPLSRLIGVTAMRAVSRIIALLLAAIAVNLIRRGWQSQV